MPGLRWGPTSSRRIAEDALAIPGADGVEVLLMHEWGGLTRFAKSEIHQSTSREDTGLRVRVVERAGGRGGHERGHARRGGTAAQSAREMAEIVARSAWPGLRRPRPPWSTGTSKARPRPPPRREPTPSPS